MATATVVAPKVDPLQQMKLEGEAEYRKIILALVAGEAVTPDDIRSALAAAGRTTKDMEDHRRQLESRKRSAERVEQVRKSFAEIERREEEARPYAKAYWKARRAYEKQSAAPLARWHELIDVVPDLEREAKRAEHFARRDVESGRPPAEWARRSGELDQSNAMLHDARNRVGTANGQVEAIQQEVNELKDGEKLKDAQRRLVEANKQFKAAEQRLEACQLVWERRREHLHAIDRDWRILDWD